MISPLFAVNAVSHTTITTTLKITSDARYVHILYVLIAASNRKVSKNSKANSFKKRKYAAYAVEDLERMTNFLNSVYVF